MIRRKKQILQLRTAAGPIAIEAVYGQDPSDGQWLCPTRQRWGLTPRQRVTPELEQRLCLTATLTGSFEAAAQLALAWGAPVDDTLIHRCVERAGQRAAELSETRVERALDPATRAQAVAQAAAGGPLDSALVIMMDGWMERQRGDDWGLKPPEKQGDRVAWREVKTAIVFRLDARAATAAGRRMIVRKWLVAWRGDPGEFGRRVHAEALRRGLNQAQHVYVVADGAAWIWNIAADRLGPALEVVDLYHARQHLWEAAHELYEGDEARARRWIAPLLERLEAGQAGAVAATLGRIAGRLGRQGCREAKAVETQAAYFESHGERMRYDRAREAGCPAGSGAMESTCAQMQGRFKRPGQFWSDEGQRLLMELELARRNDDWEAIWKTAA